MSENMIACVTSEIISEKGVMSRVATNLRSEFVVKPARRGKTKGESKRYVEKMKKVLCGILEI